MKVITEETLKEMRASRIYPEWVIDCLIRNNLKDIGSIHEENGQIIVDDLRPMSDAPRDGRYITAIFWSGSNEYHSEMYVCWNKEFQAWEEYMCDPEEETFRDSSFSGWISLPIYRPKDGEING